MDLVTPLPISDVLIRLLVSLLIGIVIGLEREIHHKAAGLRTCVLICVGATIFTMASLEFNIAGVMADPSRIAAGIVTGIGFLGAGTILQTRGSVHGLTTAATIWVMASLGLAVGIGSYWLAGGGAVLAVVVLYPLQAVERVVKGKKTTCGYTLLVTETGPALAKVMEILQGSPGEIRGVRIRRLNGKHEVGFDCTHMDEAHPRLVEELSKTPGVVEVSTTHHR